MYPPFDWPRWTYSSIQSSSMKIKYHHCNGWRNTNQRPSNGVERHAHSIIVKQERDCCLGPRPKLHMMVLTQDMSSSASASLDNQHSKSLIDNDQIVN